MTTNKKSRTRVITIVGCQQPPLPKRLLIPLNLSAKKALKIVKAFLVSEK